MSTPLERLHALAEKYGVELMATTPEDAAKELYQRVPALRRQLAFVRRNFVPKGDPHGLPLDPGNESSWDVR